MDFDLDDPLGDLLSDGSNDSFFESGFKKKDKNQKTSNSKSKVANLFGIDSEKHAEKQLPIKPATTQVATSSNSTFNTVTGGTKVTSTPKKPAVKDFNEEESAKKVDLTKSTRNYLDLDKPDDLFADLGSDIRKPKANIKKMNILDDLLNFDDSKNTTKLTSNETYNEQSARINSKSSPLTPLQTEPIKSNPITETPAATNRYSPSLGRPRSMTRANSGTNANDPLGFFSLSSRDANESKLPDAKTVEEKPKKSSTIDWLGLNVEKEPANVNADKQAIKERQEENVPSSVAPTTIDTQYTTRKPEVNLLEASAVPDMNQSMQLLNRVSTDHQTALQTLEQQQTQLNVAVQMRQQENVLLDMHNKQQTLIKQQEIQFNDLIRRQLNRQAVLEENIRQQQDQINSQINALLTQPAMGNNFVGKSIEQTDSSEEARNSNIEMEAEIKKLELEKLRLEDLMQSIRGRHEQELDLLETSHKKQITLLEESLTNLENRLRLENKSMEEYYLKQISTLNKTNEELTSKSEDRITQLTLEHEKILKKLRSDHENEIENIKNDHRIVIENIRSSKLLEFSVVQENGSYLNTLKNASKNLENASDNLQSLKVEMESNIERLLNDREIQLEAREKRLEDQKKVMEKTLEAAELERTRLMELVKSLELKMNSLEQTSVEEQWSMRQQRSNIEVERVALEREKQFYREKQAAEEKRIQDLKQQQLLEYNRLMDQIESERGSILAERVKLETMARIQPSSSRSTLDRNEIEAAIKVAQDAAHLADVEREKLLESQRLFEVKKRELLDKENSIESKQRDLESYINDANMQKRQAEYAARSYKALEQKMISKLQELHRNFNELADREAKISQEKTEISKDRLQLNNLRKKLFQNRCSLCKIDDRTKEITGLLTKDNNQVLNVTDSTAVDSYLNSTRRINIMNDIDDVLNIDNLLNSDSLIANYIPSSIINVDYANQDFDLDFQENI